MKKKYKKLLRDFPIWLYNFALKERWYEKGIYAIYEPYTGMLLYIGKTDDCFINRWTGHQRDLEYGRHCNKMLQWKFLQGTPIQVEHGVYEDYNFIFKAIHICADEASEDEVLMLESYYINRLNPMYNVVRKKLNEEELEWIESTLVN